MRNNRTDLNLGNNDFNKLKPKYQALKSDELNHQKLQKLAGYNELQKHIDLSLKELEWQHFSQKRDTQRQRERLRLLNSKPSDN